VKRLAEFIRSVIPADPFQLLFLGGVVCFIAAPGLRGSLLAFLLQGNLQTILGCGCNTAL
jgi:uncharacterized membrane protein